MYAIRHIPTGDILRIESKAIYYFGELRRPGANIGLFSDGIFFVTDVLDDCNDLLSGQTIDLSQYELSEDKLNKFEELKIIAEKEKNLVLNDTN